MNTTENPSLNRGIALLLGATLLALLLAAAAAAWQRSVGDATPTPESAVTILMAEARVAVSPAAGESAADQPQPAKDSVPAALGIMGWATSAQAAAPMTGTLQGAIAASGAHGLPFGTG